MPRWSSSAGGVVGHVVERVARLGEPAGRRSAMHAAGAASVAGAGIIVDRPMSRLSKRMTRKPLADERSTNSSGQRDELPAEAHHEQQRFAAVVAVDVVLDRDAVDVGRSHGRARYCLATPAALRRGDRCHLPRTMNYGWLEPNTEHARVPARRAPRVRPRPRHDPRAPEPRRRRARSRGTSRRCTRTTPSRAGRKDDVDSNIFDVYDEDATNFTDVRPDVDHAVRRSPTS